MIDGEPLPFGEGCGLPSPRTSGCHAIDSAPTVFGTASRNLPRVSTSWITLTAQLLERSPATKAILRPSGDHTGEPEAAHRGSREGVGEPYRCRRPEPSAFTTKIWWAPPIWRSKAMRVPSGDQEGWKSRVTSSSVQCG